MKTEEKEDVDRSVSQLTVRSNLNMNIISICDVVVGKSITENQLLSDAMNNAGNVIEQAEMPQIAPDWSRYTKGT